MLTLIAAKPRTVDADIRDAVVDLSDGDCIVVYRQERSVCMLFRTALSMGAIVARLDTVLPEEDKYFIAAMGAESLFYQLNHVSVWLQNPLIGRGLEPKSPSEKAPASKKPPHPGEPAKAGPAGVTPNSSPNDPGQVRKKTSSRSIA